MDINSINTSKNIGYANSTRSLGLIPPNELFNKPKETYKQDNISVFGKNTSVSDISQMAIGGLSAYKYHGTIVEAGKSFANTVQTGGAKEVFASLKTNSKLIGQTTLDSMGIAAMIGGGVSLIGNTASVFKGKETFENAVTNVVSDTITSGVSAAGGVIVGGAASLALSAFKVTGTPLTIAAIIGGAVGATLTNKFFETHNLKDAIKRI